MCTHVHVCMLITRLLVILLRLLRVKTIRHTDTVNPLVCVMHGGHDIISVVSLPKHVA